LGQFVGNQNGYVEFSVRNISTGVSASGDVAVYADNGTPTTNYIDMGINNSGAGAYAYAGTVLGKALDAYLYNVGGNLIVGNANSTSPSQSLFLFANPSGQADVVITGSRMGLQKSGSLNATLDVNGSVVITGSLIVSQSITATLNGTASYATNALTSSYALIATSASYATTSSYSKDFVIGTNGTLTFDQTLTDYYSVAASANGSNNLFTQTTGSYTSGFYKYTVSNGTNARTGEVMAVWNGGSVTYTDISTTDIGNTNAVTASVAIVTNQAQFNIQTNTSGWLLKAIATYM